jgi:hypothetical protein
LVIPPLAWRLTYITNPCLTKLNTYSRSHLSPAKRSPYFRRKEKSPYQATHKKTIRNVRLLCHRLAPSSIVRTAREKQMAGPPYYGALRVRSLPPPKNNPSSPTRAGAATPSRSATAPPEVTDGPRARETREWKNSGATGEGGIVIESSTPGLKKGHRHPRRIPRPGTQTPRAFKAVARCS